MLAFFICTLASLFAICVAFVACKVAQLYRHKQEPFPSVLSALSSDDAVTVNHLAGGHLLFTPTRPLGATADPASNDTAGTVGIVYLPGALVHHHAYAPLCRLLCRVSGSQVLLLRMRLRIAPFSKGIVSSVLRKEAAFGSCVIGGHSLGGQTAAALAAAWPMPGITLRGCFLHASYYSGSVPLDAHLPVLQVLADCDGVISADGIAKSRTNLPRDTIVQTIAGGNHAGFGHYGPQQFPRPDGEATVAREEQQRRAAELTTEWLRLLHEEAAQRAPLSPMRRQSSLEVVTDGLSSLREHDSSPLAASPRRSKSASRWAASPLASKKDN